MWRIKTVNHELFKNDLHHLLKSSAIWHDNRTKMYFSSLTHVQLHIPVVFFRALYFLIVKLTKKKERESLERIITACNISSIMETS